jgi:D-glycero-D-manno-heptose 1,7-bisphosphate phosphatase
MPDLSGDAPQAPHRPGREALFLDRDGVINVDKTYVAHQSDFEWCPGIFRLTRVAADRGIPIVVITNQSGIGKGYYTQADFDHLNAWMCAEFAACGTPISAVYHCPYHPEAIIPALRADHPWRKPAPGMLLAAARDLNLDLTRSVMIGDQWNDMIASARAGIGTAVLVGTPRHIPPEPRPPVIQCPDTEAAADWYARHIANAAAPTTP